MEEEQSIDIVGTNNIQEKVDISERFEVKDLENPRFDERPFLEELKIGEVLDIPLYTYPQADFKKEPDLTLGRRLNSIMDASSKAEVFLRLSLIAGSTPALWSLLTKGISSGLSNGTMDIIYRVNVPPKVNGLLDNLDIAIGCLQRRIVISNVIAKNIASNEVQRIVSIAGGSCIIPIEAIYQIGKYGMQIASVDYSPKANEKAESIKKAGEAKKDLGIGIKYLSSDLINEGVPIEANISNPQLFECTGFWEYLNPEDRGKFLNRISEAMKDSDTFILTALVDNPQQDLFDKMGFKQLHPQKMEEFIKQIEEADLHVKEVYLTPNKAYATAVVNR